MSQVTCFTMLSTSQVFQEWSNVLKLLAEVKAHAAAHPDQQSSSIKERLAISMAALLHRIASPVTTWTQLLKKEGGRDLDILQPSDVLV
jgi:hypothetical protein